MSVAMVLPVLVLLLPFWMGLLPGLALTHAGHLLMVPAMVLAMLRRRDEYTREHVRVAAAPRAGSRTGSGRITTALRHRWPTGLALLVTFDNWLEPVAPSPWVMLVLPGGYLLIGAARRTLRDRRLLAVTFESYLSCRYAGSNMARVQGWENWACDDIYIDGVWLYGKY
ncbi:MAG TPA: hypothetical protein VK453_09170 [Micromonosporaceae bacterium]|nr:hypothetical protein [Micromonosporaceae bacterium]